MRKYAGAGLVVLGILLTTFGLDSSDSMNSRVSRMFSGGPADALTWLLAGGVLSVIVGLWLAAPRRRPA